MTALWRLIDPVAPGSGSFMVMASSLYWLAFGLVAVLAGRRSLWVGLVLPLGGLRRIGRAGHDRGRMVVTRAKGSNSRLGDNSP